MDRIVLGDCLDPESGLPSLPNDSVDHVISDPPYEQHTHENRRSNPVRSVDMGFEPITDGTRFACARELARVCRGWVVLFCEDTAIGKWLDVLQAAGAKRRTTCLWVKRNAAPKFSGEGPAQGFEAMVTVWAGMGRSRWNAGGRPGIYEYNAGKKVHHTTEKPLDLMDQLLLDFSRHGEVVCDPFCGSGSTLVAAKVLGRRWLGWEVDPVHHATALRRVVDAREQTTIEQRLRHRRVRQTAFEEGEARSPKQGKLDV